MFPPNHILFDIALRTAAIYFVVLAGMRLIGKGEIGQMTPFDLVLLLLIANAVQNAMTGPDVTLAGGIVAATTLLVINFLLTQLAWRSKNMRRLVEGTPTLLIHNGKLIQKNLNKEKITHEELEQSIREHGVAGLAEVAQATLEIDGAISVLKKEEMPQATRPHHRIRFLRKN